MEEEKPLSKLTDAELDSLKTEYKKFWEEHKEEIIQKSMDALVKVIVNAVQGN